MTSPAGTDQSQIAEKAALLGRLAAQRGHVLGILRGLSDEQLRRSVLPSGWTCLALVRHLAVDVERFWFRGVVAGQPVDFDDSTGWLPEPAATGETVLGLYRDEVRLAADVLARAGLEAPPVRWPSYFTDFRLTSTREVLLHVITETATHAGQLDAVRELIDGRTWLGDPETRVSR
ncbi:MAG TPA: DinB family protein [Streptosporangiaceae bacterium]|jgi:uncharacterized damage-inducible protein DinB